MYRTLQRVALMVPPFIHVHNPRNKNHKTICGSICVYKGKTFDLQCPSDFF